MQEVTYGLVTLKKIANLKENKTKIMDALNVLKQSFQSDFNNSWQHIEQGKLNAARLYVNYSNRKINLSKEEFKTVIDVLEYH